MAPLAPLRTFVRRMALSLSGPAVEHLQATARLQGEAIDEMIEDAGVQAREMVQLRAKLVDARIAIEQIEYLRDGRVLVRSGALEGPVTRALAHIEDAMDLASRLDDYEQDAVG